MASTCFDLVNNRQFSQLNQYDCHGYIVKLHLMYQYLKLTSNNKELNQLKPILSRYHQHIHTMLPFVQLDLNAVSKQIQQNDYSKPRNKSQLELQQEFENGSPTQRIMMITEEFYHFSRGVKQMLYYNGIHKFFLCRHADYQHWIRLIVVLLFYIPSYPLKPKQIIDVVLSHCKNRLDFTAHLFRNIPYKLLTQLIQQLVVYTEKHISVYNKVRQSSNTKKMDQAGKQIEIMKRIFRNISSFSSHIAHNVQNIIVNKQILPGIYMELSLSLQDNEPKLFIKQFYNNLTNLKQLQYIMTHLKLLNNKDPMVKKLNVVLQKTVTEYNRLKLKIKNKSYSNSKQEKDDNDNDIDMKSNATVNDANVIAYNKIMETMEQLITIYITFVCLVPNIEIEFNSISCILSIIESDAAYSLLSSLLIFILLCPRFLKMNQFKKVCNVYCNHPIIDIDYFMMIHYITVKDELSLIQLSIQPILDTFRQYTKLPVNINSSGFPHFIELRRKFIQSNITGNTNINDNYSKTFFINTKHKLLNHNRIQIYLNKMKIINCNNKHLNCSKLYLSKLKRFLNTAQFIFENRLFSLEMVKMDEWLFDVISAVCWRSIKSGFPSISLGIFKLLDRCAMYSCEIYLKSATSSDYKIGIESFYNYIQEQLQEHKECGSITCYDNPLKITLCIYFMLLCNHRYYKGCNRKRYNYAKNNSLANNNDNLNDDIIMNDPNNNNLNDNMLQSSFQKASNYHRFNSQNTLKPTYQNPPFPVHILYALPVTGCIEYLCQQIQADNNIDYDCKNSKEMIEKSIEKIIYPLTHHYPHLLYWLDLNKLLTTEKFQFIQYGLNLDLMDNQLHFIKSQVINNNDIKLLHQSFIYDFLNNKEKWLNDISFNVPQIFYSLITSTDLSLLDIDNISLLPEALSFNELADILNGFAASFEKNDLLHHKWQYLFCYWWHKYFMSQPLTFICLSLQSFLDDNTDLSDIRSVLQNPSVLLQINTTKYPNIWSNTWFMNVYIRIIHTLLTAAQGYLLSSHPYIYSILTTEDKDPKSNQSNLKIKEFKDADSLRSLLVLNEVNILESIMNNVINEGDKSNECIKLVIQLLIWRNCQSLSQGNCYVSAISRSKLNNKLHLQTVYEHKNFKSFRSFITKKHEIFGFDVVLLLLSRTIPYKYVSLLINKLVVQYDNDWNILHKYRYVIMNHFESFWNKYLSDCDDIMLLSSNLIKCFDSMISIQQAWLFSIIFIVEAVILTDDDLWINCLKYIIDEINDILNQLKLCNNINDREYFIQNKDVRINIINTLKTLWLKLKNTKYMMDGFILKQMSLMFSATITDAKQRDDNWPYVQNNKPTGND